MTQGCSMKPRSKAKETILHQSLKMTPLCGGFVSIQGGPNVVRGLVLQKERQMGEKDELETCLLCIRSLSSREADQRIVPNLYRGQET